MSQIHIRLIGPAENDIEYQRILCDANLNTL